jgi:hypothetical protein
LDHNMGRKRYRSTMMGAVSTPPYKPVYHANTTNAKLNPPMDNAKTLYNATNGDQDPLTEEYQPTYSSWWDFFFTNVDSTGKNSTTVTVGTDQDEEQQIPVQNTTDYTDGTFNITGLKTHTISFWASAWLQLTDPSVWNVEEIVVYFPGKNKITWFLTNNRIILSKPA